MSKEESRRIFRKELYQLKEQGYVNADQYETISQAHHEYYTDFLSKEKLKKDAELHEAAVEKPESTKTPVSNPKVIKAKQRKTAEEIRERNISWSLNLGVIMLLIGGLYVATSNWETMQYWMKAGSIAMVSALFYGISLISYRILKIEKTAFAFVVLGSLFLPIFALSLSWFGLLGSFLSFYGEGRFILGALSSTMLIPIYITLAEKLSSRLFVWFVYISASASAAYLLKAFGLDTDGFYLGMMIYNTMLILLYHYLNNKGKHTFFKIELVIYSQANLILTTFFMLFLYENHIYYGFNLILTAAIYLSMIYVNGRKEYHFVFTTMFVYGAYQILENLHSSGVSLIGYSLLGFVFLMIPSITDKKYALRKAFQMTSAAVSGFAFIMVTFEGMLLRSETPSLSLFFAYILIAANFIYLANKTDKNGIFRYLSPVFLASSLLEGILQLDRLIHFESLTLPIYFIGFLIHTLFGWQLKIRYLKVVQSSSRDVGMVIMLFSAAASLALGQWWELGLMFSLIALLFYLLEKIDHRIVLHTIAGWAAPVTLGFSQASIGEELRAHSVFYNEFLGIPGNFAVAGILLITASFFFKKINRLGLSQKAFFVSHAFYGCALLFTFMEPIPDLYGESLIWLIGILMSWILYKTTKDEILSFLPGIISLAWYIITFNSLDNEVFHFSGVFETLILPGGAWLLLAAAQFLAKNDELLKSSLSWVAHVYLVPVLAISFVAYEDRALLSFSIAAAVYAVNIVFVRTEWVLKALLYGAYTMLFLSIKTGILYFNGFDHSHYASLATSLLIGAFWLSGPMSFKKRTEYYLVPFSLLGMASFLKVYPFTWTIYGLIILYAILLLVVLHRIKWDQIAIVPLLMIYSATIQMIFLTRMDVIFSIAWLAAFGAVLLISGWRLYPKLILTGGALRLKLIDSYTIIAIFYIIAILFFKSETFWAQIIHGIFMSAAIWIQRNRIHFGWKPIVTFLSGAYLLVPYYAGVEQLDLPALWEMEAAVLPFVLLVIFLRFVLKGKWEQITGYLQWGILVFVSIALILDGLASNTVQDALILGTLSLLAMLAGMWLRVKAYFFVGAGVLLLNVILQTRPFWGNLPWWGYLLITGTILISVASFNEWNKQKAAKGETVFYVKLKEKISSRLKNWH